MSEYGLLVQAENTLPEVQMADVDTIRGIKSNGDSIEIPKENFELTDTQINVNVPGIASDNLNSALLEISGEIDSLDSNKADITYVDQQDNLKVDKTLEVIAGRGTTGGGSLSENRTINVETANEGININDNDIELMTVDNFTDESTKKPSSARLAKVLKTEKEDIANKSLDMVADASSTTKYPSVKTVKDYVDAIASGLLENCGSYDASTNLFPSTGGSGTGGAILKNDLWYISVEGILAGKSVKVGSAIFAKVDNPGQTDSNWSRLGSSLTYVPEDVANKAVGIVANTGSDTKYPTVKAVEDYSEKLSNKSTNVVTDAASDTKYPSVKSVVSYSEKLSNKSTNMITDAASTDKYPSVKLAKDYIDSQVIANIPVSTATTNPEIAFHQRVAADSGSIIDLTLLRKWFGDWLRTKASFDRAYIFELGIKERTSGANKFASKFYDLMTGNYDGVQATDATQPYSTINAAPNSRKGLKFVNGQTQTGLMDFTDKVYAAGDSWTAIFTFKPNKKGTVTRLYFGAGYLSIEASQIVLHNGTDAVITATTSLECGKTYDIEFQYANGVGSCNVSDIPVVATVASKAITFGQFSYNSSYPFDGILYSFMLASSRISRYDSTQIYQTLRAMFPEIEGIGIGNQYWATSNFEGVVAGDGTQVAEIQGATTAGNAELIASTDFNNWTRDASVTGFGVNNFSTNAAGGCSKTTYVSLNKPNRTILAGTCDVNWSLYDGSTKIVDIPSGAFDLTSTPAYWRYTTSLKYQLSAAGTITFTSQSNKECGAADSTLVYNYVYAATSGTATVKDIAATKAAAMWCHYNNDPALGAIYGKLYNWYAVYTLSLNPPRGWRVPTSADFTQLQTYLGGASVAGGKLKHTGTAYWNSPNTGATNESGLSLLPSGRRNADGTVDLINTYSQLWTATQTDATTANLFAANNVGSDLTGFTNINKIRGQSLRLLRNAPNIPDMVEKTTGYITNNIQATPLDMTGMVGGTFVNAFRLLSETAITGLQAVLYTGAGVAKETLFSGVNLTANVKAEIPISVLQSLQDTDYTVRLSCTTKTDTAGRFMVNSILKNAYTTQA